MGSRTHGHPLESGAALCDGFVLLVVLPRRPVPVSLGSSRRERLRAVAAQRLCPGLPWQTLYNVVGPAEVTRALLPALRAARGRVVFINAVAGLHGVPRWAAFAGSKAALTELADDLRAEEAAHGVRVTSVYPGGIATEALRKVRAEFGHEFHRPRLTSPESFAQVIASIVDAPADVDIHEMALKPPPIVD